MFKIMIKNIIIPYIIALALAISATACSSHDDPVPSSQSALILKADVYDIDAESSSLWHSGQPFGVYMLHGDNIPVESNARYLADNRGVTGYLVPEGNALLFPADGSPVKVAAYYPYSESAITQGHRCTIEVREGTAPDAYLWAAAGNASSSNPCVRLGFRSQLAQLQIRVLNDDPAIARMIVRIENAPRSCAFDILNGLYIGEPDCTSPIGMTVKVCEGAFEITGVVAATMSAEGGPRLVATSVDKSGREIRRYPPVALGAMLKLNNGREFKPNTIYKLAGNINVNELNLQFTGSSPICILNWGFDPDEESGTIIKKNTNQ